MHILLTGATGFIGSAIARAFVNTADDITVLVREKNNQLDRFVVQKLYNLHNLEALPSDVVSGVDCVIHAAARSHILKDEVADPLAEYRRVNVEGTLNLARQAAAARVKRFIFISSIKVNGEQTLLSQRFTADDMPAPEDAYGISKSEAEQGLLQLAAETGIEVVIIRPPLVYGPGVKGNFASMINLIEKGLPLPLGSIKNQRSLVAIDNLVDLIIICIDHPAASNQVFLAGDGEDISTSDLLRGVAKAMNKPSRLIPVPSSVLMFAATVLGKRAVAQRVLGSLQVDISKTCELLGWLPPISFEEGLRRCFESPIERDPLQ